MSTILPKIRLRRGENIGNEIFVTPPYLDNNNHTFLTTDYAAGVTSLSVDNGNKFAINDYVVIGQIGGEKTEIVLVSGVTATTLTVGTTVFAHNRGEKITFIPYNQIVPEHSTDGGLNYSVLSTVNIRPDSTETYLQRSADLSSDYYRVRFFNATTLLYSDYSDGIIASGFTTNSVGYIIRSALISLGEKIDSVVTKEFLYTALNEGRHELDSLPGVEQWSFRTAFDYDAGNVIPGQNTLILPTDIRNDDTYKNVLSVRIGGDKVPLWKVDKIRMNLWYESIQRTTLNGAITTGSTSIILTSSGDFFDSGSIDIAGEVASDVIDSVTYTANTKLTNTLSGVTEIQAAGHSSGAVVWQGATFGRPYEYTVDNSVITFNIPFDEASAGNNIWLDYYKKITDINSDGDTLDEPDTQAFTEYLKYRIKLRRNADLNYKEDACYAHWIDRRNAMVAKEFSGNVMRLIPSVPGNYPLYG